MLRHAAKNEERRQEELKKHRQYQADHTNRSFKKPTGSTTSGNPPRAANKPEARPSRDGKLSNVKCWNCGGVGHVNVASPKGKALVSERIRSPQPVPRWSGVLLMPRLLMIHCSISIPMTLEFSRYESMIRAVHLIV
jgi:hypothetical protein